jgi:hypothetical protein
MFALENCDVPSSVGQRRRRLSRLSRNAIVARSMNRLRGEATVPRKDDMHPQPIHALPLHRRRAPVCKAFEWLGAEHPEEARVAAERELARGPRCRCCLAPRVHLARYVGSTIFTDDDPAALLRAIPLAERGEWSERLIAACIVLHARPRVSLF